MQKLVEEMRIAILQLNQRLTHIENKLQLLSMPLTNNTYNTTPYTFPQSSQTSLTNQSNLRF